MQSPRALPSETSHRSYATTLISATLVAPGLPSFIIAKNTLATNVQTVGAHNVVTITVVVRSAGECARIASGRAASTATGQMLQGATGVASPSPDLGSRVSLFLYR